MDINKTKRSLLNLIEINRYCNFYSNNIILNRKVGNFFIKHYTNIMRIGPFGSKKGNKYIWVDEQYFKYNLFKDVKTLYVNISNYMNKKSKFLFFSKLSQIYSYYCYM